MSLNVKVLGHGKIGGLTTDYEMLTCYANNPSPNASRVPSGKAVIVKNVRLVSAANRTVTIYYVPSGDNPISKAVSPIGLNLTANNLVILDEELTLVAGDRLHASIGGTAADNVDFVISGVERDQT